MDKKGKIAHEFNPVIYPFKLWVGVDRTRLVLDDFYELETGKELLYSTNALATTYAVGDKETNTMGVLIHSCSKRNLTVNTIAHEAKHAVDMFMEMIGEYNTNTEAAAYLVGWVADCIDRVKRKG